MRRKLEKERYEEVLPLVCYGCSHHWEGVVKPRAKRVQCPACQGFFVGILPPTKILESNHANHYNTPETGERSEGAEVSDRVLRAFAREPEDAIDIEIIEEVG